MTALRRIAPLLAPRVSSRAVGSTRPIPIRPRVSRNRYGSIFQTSFDERSLPSRVLENAAYARLNQPRVRLGSTYLTRAGIGGSPVSRTAFQARPASKMAGVRGCAGDSPNGHERRRSH